MEGWFSCTAQSWWLRLLQHCRRSHALVAWCGQWVHGLDSLFHVLGMFQQTVFSFYLAYWTPSWAHNFALSVFGPNLFNWKLALEGIFATSGPTKKPRTDIFHQWSSVATYDQMSVSFLQPKGLQLRKVPIGAMSKCSHGALFFFIHVVWIRPACYTSLLDVIRSRCKMFALRWFHPFSSQRTAWWCLQALGAWMTFLCT